ncbi:T9SS type A sorting domain-containing protein [Candidatus Marinimicrobia bacterium]|nr:T9SS type A sorting domain-containing protein [Candidatus Neomarinimicrobiota bacterium]|tara:strand:+ start:777 stop:1520 length:744 start_codon:yes stop_codon:yes gene_type:complete
MKLFNFKKKIFCLVSMTVFISASDLGDFAGNWEGYESLNSPSSNYQDKQIYINIRTDDVEDTSLVYVSNSYFIYNGYLDWADHYFSYNKNDNIITFSRRFNTPLGIIGTQNLAYKILDHTQGRMSLEYISTDSTTIHKISVSIASLELMSNNIPNSVKLKPNYPNPFNPLTSIPVVVKNTGEVTVNIYDSNGAFVKEVFKGILNSGEFLFRWDGISQSGNKMSSGQYFCKLIINNEIVASTKMILLK